MHIEQVCMVHHQDVRMKSVWGWHKLITWCYIVFESIVHHQDEHSIKITGFTLTFLIFFWINFTLFLYLIFK